MKTIVMCIGNRDGGDDAVGPYIADVLKKEKLDGIKVIDAGTAPENFTSKVKEYKPEELVIIDAVDMGLDPGEIRIVPKEKIGVMTISTHGIPLPVLINYLEQYIEKIFLIGIQPKILNGKMTDTIRKNAEKTIKIIKEEQLESIKTLN